VVQNGGDHSVVLETTGMEAIDKRVAGEFVEWLQQHKGLNPKTVSSRVSALSMLWKWADRKGLLDGNPWVGQTSGLKKKADAIKTETDDERPYTDDELARLLHADPNADRKWTYGAALFDLLRLGLLTGARQNELASLTRRDVLPDCAGIQVRSEVAKTKNGIRRIPLHPLAQAVVAARLSALPTCGDPNAPLFPELSPGGPDKKRSWHFSKKFTDFREAVLGPDKTVDFHSLRRTFSTYMALARAAGVSAATQDMQDDLMGHKRQALSGNTYTAKDLGWANYVKAIDGMVEHGMPAVVRQALEETQHARPGLPKRVLVPRPVMKGPIGGNQNKTSASS
jgi:integrase